MSFNLASFIDHTLLSPTATEKDIVKLCAEADNYGFFSVCVNSCYVRLAAEELSASKAHIASVIGFPLGAMSTKAKIAEADYCLTEGADELDMVMNLGYLKSGSVQSVVDEIKSIKKVMGKHILKVILETAYLSTDEILLASTLSKDAGADFIKTSTGFGPGGATFEAVKIMKEVAGDSMRIKASGGIRDAATATQYIALGASRIGTSSGVKMVE
ncbi:MAG: deoxyribose-phosphate aldolase [Flavobacteriaceae bacterium]|nr:deoxyribose-phosphate aldolase [Flavobacteriaceae bacterium]